MQAATCTLYKIVRALPDDKVNRQDRGRRKSVRVVLVWRVFSSLWFSLLIEPPVLGDSAGISPQMGDVLKGAVPDNIMKCYKVQYEEEQIK